MSNKEEDLNLEELMELAATPTEDEPVTWSNKDTDVRRFVYELGIKAGETKVPAMYIYDAYEQWKGKWKKKVARNIFFSTFRKMFKRHKGRRVISYWVDPEPFDMSKENFWKIHNKRRQQKMRNEKKKKK